MSECQHSQYGWCEDCVRKRPAERPHLWSCKVARVFKRRVIFNSDDGTLETDDADGVIDVACPECLIVELATGRRATFFGNSRQRQQRLRQRRRRVRAEPGVRKRRDNPYPGFNPEHNEMPR